MGRGESEEVKRAPFLQQFAGLWEEIFSTPAHLDAAISRRPKKYKPLLHEVATTLLRRPHSIAHFLKIHLRSDEPWSYHADELRDWPTAEVFADRLFKSLRSRPDLLEYGHAAAEDFPPWMLDEWQSMLGVPGARKLAETLGSIPPMTLRVSLRQDREAIYQELLGSGVLPESAKLGHLSPAAIVCPEYAAVMHTELFEKGAYEIQDEGSQVLAYYALAPETFAPLLSERPGEPKRGGRAPVMPPLKALTVIDACAGAGGKTIALADALGGRGRVYAYDISDKKLQALRSRAVRANLQNIQTLVVRDGDETASTKKFAGTADVVLVDAPCTGWGVLRRNPDLKWRQDEGARERMPGLQQHLLAAYAPLVKPGGRLVYGVCTFRESETTAITGSFSDAHPEFLPGPGGYLGPGGCDGFYMASWTRKPK